MELNQLEYFKALAHIGHFTQAARSVAVSQPALSRSIAKLEQEIGVPLFNRIGKTIKLTPYGQTFLTHVERALQEIANGKQALVNMSEPTPSPFFTRSAAISFPPCSVNLKANTRKYNLL